MSNPFAGYRVSSPFGWRKHPITGKNEFHTGIDLVKSPANAAIKAFTAGTVLFAGMGKKGTGLGGYGNVVLIKDKNGRGQLYAHLSKVSVKKGQKVSAGTVIGNQGSTGQSTGPHLHYEVRKVAEDKVPYGWRSNPVTRCLEPREYLEDFVKGKKEISSDHIGKYVYFPPNEGNWNVYPLTKPPIKGYEKGQINPTKFGGLIYKILGEREPWTFEIQTADFGKSKVYCHPSTGAIIQASSKKPGSKTEHNLDAIVPYPGKPLKIGSRGKDVERVQRAVGAKPDGIYGKLTEAAVKAYQTRHNLKADGIVGPVTWGVMF